MAYITNPDGDRAYINKAACALDAARVVVTLTYLGIRVDRASVDCIGCSLWWPSWSITPEASRLYASTIDVAARPVNGCFVTQALVATTVAFVMACGCRECADVYTAADKATNHIEGWLEALGSSTGWPTADRAIARVVQDAARAVAGDDAPNLHDVANALLAGRDVRPALRKIKPIDNMLDLIVTTAAAMQEERDRC
jgi:hypothetical protein